MVKKETKEIVAGVVEGIQKLVEAEEAKEVERKPGAIIGGDKVPWVRKDVEAAFPAVTFQPEENIPITYNGVVYHLYADRTTTVPSIIQDIYNEHRRAVREVGRGVRLSSGEFAPVLGVGALEE